MKKLSLLFVSCLISLFFLTGCRNNEIELYVVDQGKKAVFEELVNKFENENKGSVKVNVVTSITDSKNLLQKRIEHGDLPDVIAMDGDAIYRKLCKDKLLLNLQKQSYISRVHEKYIDVLYALNDYENRNIYALPYATNVSGIIYNKSLFREKGIEVPKTWDEFVDVMEAFENAGVQPIVMTLQNTDAWASLPPWNNMTPILVPPIFVEKRLRNETTFFDTHYQVLQKYATLLHYSRQSDFLHTTYLDGLEYFSKGGAAMVINGCWSIPLVRKMNPYLDIDMMAFPTCNIPSKNTMNSGIDINLSISAKTKHKRKCHSLLEFLSRPENAQFYVDSQFSFSAVRGVELKDPACEEANRLIQKNRISDFPDHYYPYDFNLSHHLLRFAENFVKGVPDNTNINVILHELDKAYNDINNKISE